jgi:hypothetical protein
MQRIFAVLFGTFTAFWVQQDISAEQMDSEYLDEGLPCDLSENII